MGCGCWCCHRQCVAQSAFRRSRAPHASEPELQAAANAEDPWPAPQQAQEPVSPLAQELLPAQAQATQRVLAQPLPAQAQAPKRVRAQEL